MLHQVSGQRRDELRHAHGHDGEYCSACKAQHIARSEIVAAEQELLAAEEEFRCKRFACVCRVVTESSGEVSVLEECDVELLTGWAMQDRGSSK